MPNPPTGASNIGQALQLGTPSALSNCKRHPSPLNSTYDLSQTCPLEPTVAKTRVLLYKSIILLQQYITNHA